MRKVLVGLLILGSVAVYGRETANDVLIRAHLGGAFTEFDDFDDEEILAYGGEVEYLRGGTEKRARKILLQVFAVKFFSIFFLILVFKELKMKKDLASERSVKKPHHPANL